MPLELGLGVDAGLSDERAVALAASVVIWLPIPIILCAGDHHSLVHLVQDQLAAQGLPPKLREERSLPPSLAFASLPGG